MKVYRHLWHVKSVASRWRRYSEVDLYNSISDRTLVPELFALINHKAELFKNKLGLGAPFGEIVECLADYRYIVIPTGHVGGYCDYSNKTIAYAAGGLPTIMHEVGHALQNELLMFEYDMPLLSYHVAIEQQCETIGFYLYCATQQLHSPTKSFSTYFNKADCKWLAEYYNGYYHNDL